MSQQDKKTERPKGAPLFEEEGAKSLAWGWGPCLYCHGQGWSTAPEWILAWAHPEYPDMEAVSADLSRKIGATNLQTLPVRQRCTRCNGTGRKYKKNPGGQDLVPSSRSGALGE